MCTSSLLINEAVISTRCHWTYVQGCSGCHGEMEWLLSQRGAPRGSWDEDERKSRRVQVSDMSIRGERE